MTIQIAPEIVAAAREGDAQALNAILAGSRQDLRRYAEHHCQVNDVEHAVQETLFKACRRVRDMRRVESLASWLFRIVKRECNRMRRAWRMLTNQAIDERLLPVATPEPLELRTEISRALAALPAQHRQVLLLRDVTGLTLDEIARELGVSRAAAKSRLHRARHLVRERMVEKASLAFPCGPSRN